MKLLVKTKIMTQDFYHMSTAECAVQVSDSALGAKGRTDKQSVGGGGGKGQQAAGAPWWLSSDRAPRARVLNLDPKDTQ